MKRSLVLLLMTGQMVSAHTVLDPSQVLTFPVSKDGLTRISIDQDGIEDIYYPTDFADNIQHHKSGHVFVMADDVDGPIYLTIITKRGIAQDLKLTPTRKTAEPILLKYETQEIREQDVQDQTTELLKSFIQGIIPAGFYPIEIGETSRSAGSVVGVLSQAYQNSKVRVLVFDIKSESGKQALNSQALWTEGDLALAFDQPHVEEGQSAKLFVIQQV